MTSNAPYYEPYSYQGYENLSFGVTLELKKPINLNEIKIEADASVVRNEFNNVPLLSEDEAKEALAKFVNSKCCYGKDPLRKLTFIDLNSSNTYRYVLNTYTEARSTKWVSQPYKGQPIYNNGMPPPLPWTIPAKPQSLFKNETLLIEVPNTGYVKSCNECNGAGNILCSSCTGCGRSKCIACDGIGRCSLGSKNPGYNTFNDNHNHGSGHVDVHGHNHHNHHNTHYPCSSCQGHGTIICVQCNTSGRIQCCDCLGSGKVKWYIQLSIVFENQQNDFIKKSEDIPDELIRNCQSLCTFSEQNERVFAINHHTDQAINRASYDLILTHLNKFQSHHIIAQSHSVYAIPVTNCKYKYKETNYSYQIFGIDKQVYTNDYPASCCCGCLLI